MKNKKALGIVSVLLICVLTSFLASCNSRNVSNNNENKQAKKVKIRLWEKPVSGLSGSAEESYTRLKQELSEKFPNIEIEDESLKPGVDYVQQYDKALMAGEAPTAMRILSYTSIPTRIKNGTIADITNLVNDWDLKKQNKVLTQFDSAISKDGKWYAIPYQAYTISMVYNAKAIREAGGELSKLPKTWQELADMGSKLTDISRPRFGFELLGGETAAWAFTAWLWNAGGEMVIPNSDGTYKIGFNDESGIDTAKFWNEMVWKYKMTQKDVLQDNSKLMEDIKAGRSCFSWINISNLKQADLDLVGLDLADFGIMPMPVKDESITSAAFMGGEVITFNPKSTKEEIEAAWDIMTYKYYDEDFLIKTWEENNNEKFTDTKIPGRIDLLTKKFSMYTTLPDKIKSELATVSTNAKPEPSCQNWFDLKIALVKPLQKILLQEGITREEIKKILDDCAEQLYKKYPNSFRK